LSTFSIAANSSPGKPRKRRSTPNQNALYTTLQLMNVLNARTQSHLSLLKITTSLHWFLEVIFQNHLQLISYIKSMYSQFLYTDWNRILNSMMLLLQGLPWQETS